MLIWEKLLDGRYGFGVAGIGMVLGLLAFRIGSKNLENVGLPQDPNLLEANSLVLRLNI